MRRMLAGGLVGLAATGVMTGSMLAGQATGHHGEQPPKRIVRGVARGMGLSPRRWSPGTLLSAGMAHLGFGAGCGALYAALTRHSTPARGAAFGLGVWALSYAGWLPALRLMPVPQQDNPRRAWTTLAAHLVYGATLGAGLARVPDRAGGRRDRSRSGG